MISIDYYETGGTDTDVTFDINLDGHGLYPSEFYIPGLSCVDTPNVNLSCTIPDIPAGSHVLDGYITDTAGNSTYFSSSFISESPDPLSSDTVAPQCSNQSSLGLSFQAPEIISERCTDERPSSGLDPASATMSINGGPPEACELLLGGLLICHPSPDLPPGYYQYTLFISDMAGNDASVSNNFRIGTTVHLRNDENGGDCEQLGIWDQSTTTCTLTADSSSHMIIIEGDDITLDGAGHILDARAKGVWSAVTVDGGSRNTVRNLCLKWWVTGIRISDPGSENTLADNNFENLHTAIHDTSSGRTTITGNTITDSSYAGVLGAGAADSYIAGNEVSGPGDSGFGIYLHGTSHVIINNRVTGTNWALNMLSCDGMTVSGNHLTGNQNGISLGSCGNSEFFNNTIEGSSVAGLRKFPHEGTAPGNRFYNNNFLNNASQVLDDVGIGGFFSRPAPIGGNYWSDWTGPDSDGDGFVDSPYVFTGGQDDLPWATPSGWARPGLGLSLDSVYWQDYASFEAGILSMDFTVSNSGPDTSAVQVVGTQSSSNVIAFTEMPIPLGDLPAAGSTSYTLQCLIPPGVSFYQLRTWVTAQGPHGETFAYPGPFPGV